MKNMFARMIREEDGQGMVEYALIIAGIAVVIIAALALLGPKFITLFNEIHV